MTSHNDVDVDPRELENAKKMWHNFAVASKYAVISTSVILIILALAFVKFV